LDEQEALQAESSSTPSSESQTIDLLVVVIKPARQHAVSKVTDGCLPSALGIHRMESESAPSPNAESYTMRYRFISRSEGEALRWSCGTSSPTRPDFVHVRSGGGMRRGHGTFYSPQVSGNDTAEIVRGWWDLMAERFGPYVSLDILAGGRASGDQLQVDCWGRRSMVRLVQRMESPNSDCRRSLDHTFAFLARRPVAELEILHIEGDRGSDADARFQSVERTDFAWTARSKRLAGR
jgi:hypothetical protein